MSEEKIRLIADLNSAGIDIDFLIREAFLSYKYRKSIDKLYEDKAEIPTQLIKIYYGLSPRKITFDNMKKAFITKYINNESEIEGIDCKDSHNREEIKGLRKMYKYIHSDDINYMFDVFTLKDLHMNLFAYSNYPQYAGEFRNFPVYLPGTGTELCDWSMIREELIKINKDVQELVEESKEIREELDVNRLLLYLDKCIVVGCKLIKIHPFSDGNGRTIRGFVNKLLEDANLPPVYIKRSEKEEYNFAMNKANNEGDYSFIKAFYRYKVCDSIIELDINQRIKFENEVFKEGKIKRK